MRNKIFIVFLAVFLSFSTLVSATTLDRLGGKTRYETAAKINNSSTSKTLILVSGDNFADALVAAPLVYHLNGEIHITQYNSLDSNTINSLNKGEFTNAVIVGGTGVVSTGIENKLKSQLKSVVRYGGKNRYETSRLVANAILKLNDYPYAFLVSALNFPDALSVAPVSAMTGSPILLTNGDVNNTDINAINAATKKLYKIGGVAVVSNKMDSKVKREYERLGGVDRYETNQLIIEEFSNLFDKSNVYIASGSNFPDALTGSALAGNNKQAIILCASSISEYTEIALSIINPDKITALGGTGVITNDMMSKLNTINNMITETNQNIPFADQIAKETFRLINKERTKNGLKPLVWDSTILTYSTNKSKDMAKNNYFGHYDLKGKYTYNYMRENGVKFSLWAENLITANNTNNVSSIAKDMVNRWMKSSGHKSNILNKSATKSAVGIYISNNAIYGTQIFLK